VLDERGESVGLSFGDVRPLPAGDGGEGFTSFEKKPGAIVTVVQDTRRRDQSAGTGCTYQSFEALTAQRLFYALRKGLRKSCVEHSTLFKDVTAFYLKRKEAPSMSENSHHLLFPLMIRFVYAV
jgi:hypothetical protein